MSRRLSRRHRLRHRSRPILLIPVHVLQVQPKLRSILRPMITTGICAPFPSFVKNGSTAFSRNDFHP